MCNLIDACNLCPCPKTGEFVCAWLFYVASGSSVRSAVRRWVPSSQLPLWGMEKYRLWDFYDGQLQKRIDDAGCLSLRYLRRSRFSVHSIHTGSACRDSGVCLDLSVYLVCQYLCVSGSRRFVRSPAVRPSMVTPPVPRLPSVSPHQAIVVTWNGKVAASLLETVGACFGLQVDGRLHGKLWSPAITSPL